MKKGLLNEIKAMNKIAGTQLTKEQEIAIIKNRLQELEFGTQDAFDAYKKNHKMRPDTKVKVAGKNTTAGQASKNSKSAKPAGKPTKLSGSGLKSTAEKSKQSKADTKSISSHYNKILGIEDIDDELLDDEMERIVKQVGHTPEQKKKGGPYKFSFGGQPEFENLTDKQLTALEPFLKAVRKKKSFGSGDVWDGKKIVSGDEDEEYDHLPGYEWDVTDTGSVIWKKKNK